jgi:leucyl-tRNA synthetase
VSRFLQRVWRLVLEPENIVVEGSGPDGSALGRKVAQTVGKVTEHFDELRFNTAVAALMELANTLQDYLQRGGARDAQWGESVRTLVKLLNPLAPHVAEEMWERLGEKGLLADVAWPIYDPATAAEPKLTLVIQVAGRVRDRVSVVPGLTEAEALALALDSEKVQAVLSGRPPTKVIYVQDRLINLVP